MTSGSTPFEADYLTLSRQAQRFLRAALEAQAAEADADQHPGKQSRRCARRTRNTWARAEANTPRADREAALAVLLRHEARPLTT